METEVRNAEIGINPAMYMSTAQSQAWIQRLEVHPSWPVVGRIPEMMTALASIPSFTVRELLMMEKGRVFETSLSTIEMVPIMIGAVQIAWCEFEVVESVIALRITKLA